MIAALYFGTPLDWKEKTPGDSVPRRIIFPIDFSAISSLKVLKNEKLYQNNGVGRISIDSFCIGTEAGVGKDELKVFPEGVYFNSFEEFLTRFDLTLHILT